MAKEKKKREVERKDYFKELVSFFTIILMIVFLGNLGTLGFYGNLIIKVIFGDWSFLILAYILIYAVKYMIKGSGLNLHSLTFQGFIFIYLAISLLSHLTIYNELGLTSKNVFSKTLELYKTYFSSFDSSCYVGGGLIGLLLFQICIIALGKIGVIIIGIAFVIMGISYLLNHSLWDFLKKFTRLYSFISMIRHKVFNYFKKLSIIKEDPKPLKKPKLSISMLNDTKESTNLFLQHELAKESKIKINQLINSLSLGIKFIDYYVGYSSTTYSFEVSSGIIDKRLDEILKIFDYNVFYILDGTRLYLEVNNRFKELLTLKKVLIEYEESIIFPVGLNNIGDLIGLDLSINKPLLIAGGESSGVKSYIRSLIVSMILVMKEPFMINFIDIKKDFRELRGVGSSVEYIDTIDNTNKKIEELIFEYDKRYELLKYLGVSDYIEANLEIDERFKQIDAIKPLFIFLNLNLKYLSNDSLLKLKYLFTVGIKVGIYPFMILRENDGINDFNIAQFNLLIFKLKDISLSIKLLENDIGCYLQGKGDFLMLENKKISHGQAPYCSMTDYLKILEKFTF